MKKILWFITVVLWICGCATSSDKDRSQPEDWEQVKFVHEMPNYKVAANFYVECYLLKNREQTAEQLETVRLFSEAYPEKFEKMQRPVAIRVKDLNVIFYTDEATVVHDTNGIVYGTVDELNLSTEDLS